MNSKKVDGINSVAVLLGVILLLWGSLEKASNLKACGYGDILSQHFSYIAATAHDQVQNMTVGGITKAESKIVGSISSQWFAQGLYIVKILYISIDQL